MYLLLSASKASLWTVIQKVKKKRDGEKALQDVEDWTPTIASSPGQVPPKKTGHTWKLSESAFYVTIMCLSDHMVASFCSRPHYRVDGQILLRSNYSQILASVKLICSKFLKFEDCKKSAGLVPILNGLQMSLLSSCVKNAVAGNGRICKQRDLTQHIRGIFASVTRPFSHVRGLVVRLPPTVTANMTGFISIQHFYCLHST